jgi:FkbM family methyltransferase
MNTIDGHTYDEKLLTGGWVIDAGCRYWRMTDYMFLSGEKVFALDIEDFSNDIPTGVIYKHAALMPKSGQVEAHYFGDGSGNFVKGLNDQPYDGPDRPCETKKVNSITLQDIYNEIGTNIDLLKLDIELGEYDILKDLEPIPRQCTVEFHEHVNKKYHQEMINEVLLHMGKHYHMNLYVRDWPLYLFMDCLFIRKDLL